MRFMLLATLLAVSACGDTKPAEEVLAAYEPSMDAPKDVAAAPDSAKKTESGLSYKLLKKGEGGDKPTDQARVEVHYTGWTTDGKKFDSSRERNAPSKFGLKQVIPGWTEGLQLMAPGDHMRFWIPEEMAYKGRPGKPAGMLVFDVELLSFNTPPPRPEPVPPPDAPADVSAPPADAQKTKSGLAYKVLKAGSGGKKAGAKSMAVVHYAGWTASDGKNFDYSRKRGMPAAFGVGGVIPGWTEGLQLMSPGDNYRLWIPEELAYKGQPNRPAGMLVFDVELLEVHDPPDLTVPSDAKKTASGLQWKLLSAPGTGDTVPAGSRIKANWIAWSSDLGGFDSNLGREASDFTARVRRLKGLDEAVQLMHKGEKARFWLSDELAFEGRPGAPKAPIVYDVEIESYIVGQAGPKKIPVKIDPKKAAPHAPHGAPAPKGVGSKKPAPTSTKGVGSTKPAPTSSKGVGSKK